MQRSLFSPGFRLVAVVFVAVLMVSAGWAQDSSSTPSAPSAQMQAQKAVPAASQPFEVKEYSQPRSHFANPLAPYTVRSVAAPNLANTARIDQLMRDGKLYLSMSDAVALALENNLDIAIARYNLNIADTDIWRAKAGSSILGVNIGVVQNTPGGGVGGLGAQVGSGQGGTSVAAGGAGTGSGGLVVSTLGSGPLITSFDPILTGTLQLDQTRTQAVSPFSPLSSIVIRTRGTLPTSKGSSGARIFPSDSPTLGVPQVHSRSIKLSRPNTTRIFAPKPRSTCCRASDSPRTLASFVLRKTTVKSPTWRSGCK